MRTFFTHAVLLALVVLFVAPVSASAAVKVLTVGTDFYPIVNADTLANGGFSIYGSSVYHGTGSAPSVQIQRICYTIDPTAYPSAWKSGAYKSPGDNSVVKWDGTKWYRVGAKHNNNHISGGSLECSSDAVADTSISASQTTIQAGATTTLSWASQYGKIRQATCSGTNFTTDTFVPAHFETVLVTNPVCRGGGGITPGNLQNAASAAPGRLLAGTLCGPFLGQVWVPDSTGAAPYGGSKDVAPTQTTTYTYTCTNANGPSSASVTVYVGPNQCNDGIDNDNDGLVDSQDPGCTFRGPGNPSVGNPAENADLPDLTASAVSPSNVIIGTPVTLTSVIKNQGGSETATGFTDLFQFDNDSDHTTVTATKTASSPKVASGGSDNAQVTYTFPTKGTWYVRACADNDESWKGTIAESNENNNCSTGGWTQITVGNQAATLYAVPPEVAYGAASTLTWACGNAKTAIIDNGIGAVTPASGGSITTGDLFDKTSYTLTCTGDEVLKAFTTVGIIPPTLSIQVSPLLVRRGESVTVSWSVIGGGKGCIVSGPGLITSLKLADRQVVQDVESAQTYTLSCNGAGSKSATVNLLPAAREQ